MSARGPGETLFAFVRHWSRRTSSSGADVGAEQGRLVLVAEAVHALTERGIVATINAVADEVGIDQSGASRLIKNATEAGYLTVQRSESDGRQRQVMVSSSGLMMLEHAHAWQEQVFARMTRDWSDQQRREFQRSMTELIDRSYGLEPSVLSATRVISD